MTFCLCGFLLGCNSGGGQSAMMQAVPTAGNGGTETGETSPTSNNDAFSEFQAFSSHIDVDDMHAADIDGKGAFISYVTPYAYADEHPELQSGDHEATLVQLTATRQDGADPSEVRLLDYLANHFHDDVHILKDDSDGITFTLPIDSVTVDRQSLMAALMSAFHADVTMSSGLDDSQVVAQHSKGQLTFHLSASDSSALAAQIVGRHYLDSSLASTRIEMVFGRSKSSEQADEKDMGLLELLHAERAERQDQHNTYGIAPMAHLRVFSVAGLHDKDSHIGDAVHKARGDKDVGHIVVLNNALFAEHNAEESNAELLTMIPLQLERLINFLYGSGRSVNTDMITPMLTSQPVGKEDIYIMAALDEKREDAGSHALIPHIHKSLRDNTIVVVDDAATAAGCGLVVQDYCLAAAGDYRYRTKGADGVYQSQDDALAQHRSANAAAMHVAGGIALLEQMFRGQMSMKEIVHRVMQTAAQHFDNDGDGSNDYDPRRHGQGFLDLACAVRPMVSSYSPSCRPAQGAVAAPSVTERAARDLLTLPSTGVTSASSLRMKARREYQNQPTLAQINAVYAYARGVTSRTNRLSNLDQLNWGKGAQVSVLTTQGFDPTHPEFFSSRLQADYHTLTRFRLRLTEAQENTADALLGLRRQLLMNDGLRFYGDGAQADAVSFSLALSGVGIGGVDEFDRITRNNISGSMAGDQLERLSETILRRLESTDSEQEDTPTVILVSDADGYHLSFEGADSVKGVIPLTSALNDAYNLHHIGRRYTRASNIVSYQHVVAAAQSLQDDDGGDVSGVSVASDASMGIMALINGLRDPERSITDAALAANTHGVAPEALLHVFSSPSVGMGGFNAFDLISRARGIDLDRERTEDGRLRADATRNIVLIQNDLAAAARTEAVTQAHIDAVVGTVSGALTDDYKAVYDALKVGIADTAKQDIYVFAAADGRSTQRDVGLLAALPMAKEADAGQSLQPYALAVVAAEADSTSYCGRVVEAFCLAAPGAYKYIDKESGDDAAAYDESDVLADAASANAASALVAGGIAVLESIFADQLTSKALVARVLETAAQRFDLDADGVNDYDALKHGQGLLDLACASRPIVMSGNSRCRPSADSDKPVQATTRRAEAAALFTASTASVTAASAPLLKLRHEYQNQPSLDIVGAAAAYARLVDRTNPLANLDGLRLGQGSRVHYVTTKAFDPTHPEFFSSRVGDDYDVLAKALIFLVGASEIHKISRVAEHFFANDHAGVVKTYLDGMTSANIGGSLSLRTFFEVTLPGIADRDQIGGGVTHEVLLSEDGRLLRRGILDFFRQTMDGPYVKPTAIRFARAESDLAVFFQASTSTQLFLDYTDRSLQRGLQYIGRRYGAESNIASHRLIRSNVIKMFLQYADGRLTSEGALLADYDDADMGVMALINGLADPERSITRPLLAANTHGIAPHARLHVYQTPRIGTEGAKGTIITDMIYQARGIDVGRNKVNPKRDIVLLSNHITPSALTGAVTKAQLRSVASISHEYGLVRAALQEGVADTKTQDIYVFAAQDNQERTKDVGLFAAMPLVAQGGADISPYSLAVVAMERGSTSYCGQAVREFCLAAPGSYFYIDKESGDDASAYDDNDVLVQAVSANAAAALTAGGIAVLESLFSNQITSKELVARVLATASRDFDMNNDGTNDYDAMKHGQGLLDLACASRPLTRSGRCAKPSPQASPMQASPMQASPQSFESASAQQDDASRDVSYCGIEGLRVILSGGLCSDDYITISDRDGNLITDVLGGLRLGRGFGDVLGGISFFDAFDTAWKADNPYNPYAALLDFAHMVKTSVGSFVSLDERFHTMRYGVRPERRKEWRYGDASVSFAVAPQSVATKPAAMTRSDSAGHDPMDDSPYATMRFMASAETALGSGRMRFMAHNGVAMGYALGLHAEGDNVIPSHFLPNRDSFHAPYLALASAGFGGGMRYRLEDGSHIGFVVGEGTSLNTDGSLPAQQKQQQPRALAGMVEYAPHRNLMFHAGALREDSTLLASQGSGLFDIQGGMTTFVGVQARQPLMDNWHMVFSGYAGRTTLDDSKGIVSGLDVITSSFDLGLVGADVLRQDDSVMLRASQPLRVEDGTLDLSYVSFRTADRQPIATVQPVELAAQERAVAFGIDYRMAVGGDGHLQASFDYVRHDGHRGHDAMLGMMSLNLSF